MANTINIEITNAVEIEAAFRLAPAEMRAALTKVINKSLLSIGKAAAKNSPVRTGNLRSSILDPERGLKLDPGGLLRGSVGSGTNYGLFVEKGTRFMAAQPFLQPAVDSNIVQVQTFFVEAVKSVLDKIALDSGGFHI